MNEPAWIEHGDAPMPKHLAGHDVEVRFGNGRTSRDSMPHTWAWGWDGHDPEGKALIVAYRDWSSFNADPLAARNNIDSLANAAGGGE